ncbi:MAG TPA: FadR/GntR family transcriptional regulator [Streptosporangiaceae bacterium]|jgi:GntR family transcriptional repressor for pyruvate dehydrogenase complex|nr:FadR/GntR family transcriptional regulator [Streptosporangiaceae bacterium]
MSASQRAGKPSTDALRAPDRRRLYEQLAAQLLDFVEVTGLGVGDRLPSERDLAEALQVSRASVRQATIALEVRGTLEVRHGDGIYLRSLPNDSGRLMELMTQRHRLPAILEAREALETQLAALAAARGSDDDVPAMDKALETMAADIDSGGLGEEGDRLFHEAVTRAAHSPLLADFMAALAVPIGETRRSSLSEPGRPRRSLRAHRQILEAIRRGDVPGARQAMRRHVRMVADIGLLRWSAIEDRKGQSHNEPF